MVVHLAPDRLTKRIICANGNLNTELYALLHILVDNAPFSGRHGTPHLFLRNYRSYAMGINHTPDTNFYVDCWHHSKLYFCFFLILRNENAFLLNCKTSTNKLCWEWTFSAWRTLTTATQLTLNQHPSATPRSNKYLLFQLQFGLESYHLVMYWIYSFRPIYTHQW